MQVFSRFLSLEGNALNATLELHEDETISKDIVRKIMARFDMLYKKDDAISKFQVLEAFETYTSTIPIPEYINEFEKRLNKVKIYDRDMPDNVLAYRLLKNTNLKQSKEQKSQ